MADRPLVEVLETPALDGPVLLLALDGWIDAAGAAAEARQRLLEGDPGRRIARFDTDRLLDHRARLKLRTYARYFERWSGVF